jgi:hypothetical protein
LNRSSRLYPADRRFGATSNNHFSQRANIVNTLTAAISYDASALEPILSSSNVREHLEQQHAAACAQATAWVDPFIAASGAGPSRAFALSVGRQLTPQSAAACTHFDA